VEAILYIGIPQTLVAGILIALKKPRMIANQILAAWLLLICIEMVIFLIIFLINDTIVGLYTIRILPFSYGPLLLLYAQYMTKEKPVFDPRYLLHFLPFLIFLIASVIFIDQPVMSGTHGFLDFDGFFSFRIIYAGTFFLSITAYSVATFIEIRNHQKRLRELVSFSSGKITLQWLKGLSTTFYAGYIIMFIFGGVDILTGFMPFDPYETSFIGLTILAYLFTIFGFHQPSIFEEVVKVHIPVVELNLEDDGQKKYARSGLKKKDIVRYLKMLENHLEKDKPYKDRELTIFDLSDQLQIPRHFLSEVINEHLGKNFYTLVNEYRIEEVKKRMVDPAYKHLTILAIAYDAGFNSKSSFNTIFKQKTGETPSEYLQSFNATDS
jgi:AraC-like DNA-binding protein